MSNKGPLDQFYKDCLRLGTLKCFAHFSLYLKGREELVATIFHGALSPSAQPPPIAKVGSVGCDDALFMVVLVMLLLLSVLSSWCICAALFCHRGSQQHTNPFCPP